MVDKTTLDSEGKAIMGEDLNLLEKISAEDRESFVHKVINEICDKVGLNYEDYFKVLSVSDYSKLQHSLSSAVRIISRDVVKKEQLTEKLRSMGASADVSQVVATCVWVRKEEVRDQLVKESCNIAQSRLDDFDWKLKLIMSSSQLSSIQKPIVSLDFDITENGQKKKCDIELSKEELAELVTSLEAANKVVSQLRT